MQNPQMQNPRAWLSAVWRYCPGFGRQPWHSPL